MERYVRSRCQGWRRGFSVRTISPVLGTTVEEPSGEIARLASSTAEVSLSLRTVRALPFCDDEGEPTLIIHDGESSVELSPGLAGRSQLAASGAYRLAQALLEYAATLEPPAGLNRSGGS